MVTFFSILFVLLGINAFLLIFSVNGAMDNIKKPFQKIKDSTVLKLSTNEFSENKYKKAV
ncbi:MULTISPECIES: hypothetical protein [Flavobacteriaceae]|uniref:hypothetical protein n=1 Tax=Flavobacteriaceae TaxID=49546 RepID=UPI0010ADB948|nr:MULTISPECIES: hypothetical protein [Flavobacteriaceae]NJB37460.1 hypothetical protein [Croceivirga sp. JEA036]TKD61377.1 hypothetical protein FBT53_11375 [Flavobacterium sp. ASW18X]